MRRRMSLVFGTLLSAVALGGCYESTVLPGDGAVRIDSGLVPDTPPPPPPPPPPRTTQLDLLFVVDNSNSMAEEQASLAAELPTLLSALTSGERAFDSIQLGVVTTDMGVLGAYGVPTCGRADFGDDGILRTQGNTGMADCQATYPSFLRYDAALGHSTSEVARDLACVAAVGLGGCGFEQQLEAALKALTPARATSWTAPDFVAPVFFRDALGHASDINAGFVRDDSVLAVVMVTDEEDCSSHTHAIFDPNSSTYGGTDLNLRCFAFGHEANHPISRYVDGLMQLRRRPGRVAFVPIVGIPVDLEPRSGEPISWDTLVSPDERVRDPRLWERIDPSMPNRLVPSCNIPGRGVAFPPIRILRTARGLEARGARVAIGSICQESFRAPFMAIADALGQ